MPICKYYYLHRTQQHPNPKERDDVRTRPPEKLRHLAAGRTQSQPPMFTMTAAERVAKWEAKVAAEKAAKEASK